MGGRGGGEDARNGSSEKEAIDQMLEVENGAGSPRGGGGERGQ